MDNDTFSREMDKCLKARNISKGNRNKIIGSMLSSPDTFRQNMLDEELAKIKHSAIQEDVYTATWGTKGGGYIWTDSENSSKHNPRGSRFGIFLVERHDRYGYDDYDSFVVVARDEEHAKSTNPRGALCDFNDYFSSWARDPKDITAIKIGESLDNNWRVVCASYNGN